MTWPRALDGRPIGPYPVRTMPDVVSRVLEATRHFPPLLRLRRERYRRNFPEWPGAFLGAYSTFAEAAASAPSTHPLGYDSDGAAKMYDDRMSRIYPSDYPVLFWLQSLLARKREGAHLVDFGGHAGLAYYAYERYLTYPDDLTWTVVDVPAVVKRGQELAAERGRSQLRFTSDPASVGRHDILLASGSPQYLESPDLFETIGSVGRLPDHLVLNRIPIHDRFTYVTLQYIVTAFCPYRIFRRADFLEGAQARGYDVVDEWENLEHSSMQPFDSDHSVPSYRGFYLRRKAD
jgi:putative methyltransferase (TIGR04325 family)